MLVRRFLILTALATAAPALAEDAPLMKPSRDVAVEYRLIGRPKGSTGDGLLHMYSSAATNRTRWDSPNGRAYLIRDPGAATVTTVMIQKHVFTERHSTAGANGPFVTLPTQLIKAGTDTVAGLGCTLYDGNVNNHAGQACLTDDGVMLRGKSMDPTHPSGIVATKVTYGDQPAALFAPPPGFTKFEPPKGPEGCPPLCPVEPSAGANQPPGR